MLSALFFRNIAGREISDGVAARGLVNGRGPYKYGRDLPSRTFTACISRVFLRIANLHHHTNIGHFLISFHKNFYFCLLNVYLMHIPDIIIAIDGYSSTGKSSFARLIADEFDFLYLDSGALYRGVTLYAMENGMISPDKEIDVPALETAMETLDLHFAGSGSHSVTYMGERCVEKDIRTLAVSGLVSPIAAVPQVRAYVDRRLRELGSRKRVVLDGRDIGTTVFPDAELKIFMVADLDVRAMRRASEMQSKGENVSFDEVMKNLEERDYIDSHRKASPLAKAEDAIVLDNSRMTLQDQMEWIRKIISERFNPSTSAKSC